MNNKNEAYKSALMAVLIEADKHGLDLQQLLGKAHAGLMGAAKYAPAGTSEKTESTKVLQEAVEAAAKYKAAGG